MQMTATKWRWLLVLYIVVAALVFLYVRFPSETLRTYAAHRLSAGLPGLSVAVENVRPALFAGIELQGVNVSRGNQPLVVIDRLRIHPDWLSLLQTQTSYEISGSAGGGQIAGRMAIDSSSPNPRIVGNCQISGILLQQLTDWRGPYGSKLSGQLDGNLTLGGVGMLTGKFTVSNAKIELASPVFDQKDFSFRTADANISLQNQMLMLRNGRLKGTELDAEVSGTIDLGQPQGDNALNLSGRLTPHPAFISRAEASIPPNLMRRRTGIPFKIRGTMDAPGFSLN